MLWTTTPFDRSHTASYSAFIETTWPYILYYFRYSKYSDFLYPTCIKRSHYRTTLLEFRQGLWCQNTSPQDHSAAFMVKRWHVYGLMWQADTHRPIYHVCLWFIIHRRSHGKNYMQSMLL